MLVDILADQSAGRYANFFFFLLLFRFGFLDVVDVECRREKKVGAQLETK